MSAMAQLIERGVDPALTRIVSVVAAPALQKLSVAYPSLVVYTATIDEGLNSQGYIVPGLEMQAIAHLALEVICN
jgi:uracil phosphoribosyltransferase